MLVTLINLYSEPIQLNFNPMKKRKGLHRGMRNPLNTTTIIIANEPTVLATTMLRQTPAIARNSAVAI